MMKQLFSKSARNICGFKTVLDKFMNGINHLIQDYRIVWFADSQEYLQSYALSCCC